MELFKFRREIILELLQLSLKEMQNLQADLYTVVSCPFEGAIVELGTGDVDTAGAVEYGEVLADRIAGETAVEEEGWRRWPLWESISHAAVTNETDLA